LVLQFIEILYLFDQPVRIDTFNMLPDVSNRQFQNGTRPLIVLVDLSGDANRDVECTCVVVARTGRLSQRFSLQTRSVDCMNCTSGLSAATLLG